jgi:hypothetical protein
MMENDKREPLLRERQPGETPRSYRALLDYCRMGEGRSLVKLAETYQEQRRTIAEMRKHPSESPKTPLDQPPATCYRTLKEWSRLNGWHEAALAWDQAVQQLDQELWEERRRQQREREWDLGKLMQERAQQALELGIYYDEKGEIAGVKLPEIKASDIPKLADIGSKLVRLATGEPTERVETNDGGFTDADRAARIAALLERARARRTGPAAGGDQPE